jgi:hypothetical protein
MDLTPKFRTCNYRLKHILRAVIFLRRRRLGPAGQAIRGISSQKPATWLDVKKKVSREIPEHIHCKKWLEVRVPIHLPKSPWSGII